MSLDLLDIAIKIGLAALLAGLAGAEREWSGHWAGLRTHMIIAVGAALLTDVSIAIGELHGSGSGPGDPGRIAAQIVSGIGFLGAGTIIQARGGVHGLTTAAGLWVAAAIGLAVGAEFYREAAVTAIALFVILRLVKPLEERFAKRQTFVLRVRQGESLSHLTRVLEEAGIEPESLELKERSTQTIVKLVLRRSEDTEEKLRELVEGDDSLEFADGSQPGPR
jgi:putative Mg2+ transporter-C (MgtC) family protein